jgi:hypothetical protein
VVTSLSLVGINQLNILPTRRSLRLSDNGGCICTTVEMSQPPRASRTRDGVCLLGRDQGSGGRGIGNVQWDYSIEDAKDDTGVVDDDNIVGDEDEIWNFADDIPESSLGYGWFFDDTQMVESLRQSVDLSTRTFSTKPRPCDRQPADIPAQHPIRAIALVLQQAPPNSTVQIYCSSLSDPFALDPIIQHGIDKTVKVIL